MRFLIDAQLPPLLSIVLETAGFSAVHIDSLPKGDETPDREIAKYADDNGMIVITKDSDFYYSHMLVGQPKRLLLITTGNIKNRELFDLIRKNAGYISELLEDCSFIELSNDGLIGHEE